VWAFTLLQRGRGRSQCHSCRLWRSRISATCALPRARLPRLGRKQNRFFYVRKRDSRFIGVRIDFARPVVWAYLADNATQSIMGWHLIMKRFRSDQSDADSRDARMIRSILGHSPGTRFFLSTSALIRLASIEKPSPATSPAAMHFATTPSNTRRRASLSRSCRARQNTE
jgi:hypothetical protein